MASIENLRANLSHRQNLRNELSAELAEIGVKSKKARAVEIRAEIEALDRLIDKNERSIAKKESEGSAEPAPAKASVSAKPKTSNFNSRSAAIAAAIENNETVEDSDGSGEPEKRKRGRPRKNADTPETDSKAIGAAMKPARAKRPTLAERMAEMESERGDDTDDITETNSDDSPEIDDEPRATVPAPAIAKPAAKATGTNQGPVAVRVNVSEEIRRIEPKALLSLISDEQRQAIFRAELDRRKEENKLRSAENPVIIRKHKAEGRLELEKNLVSLIGYVSNLSVYETREYVDSDGEVFTREKKVRPVNMHSRLDIAEMVQGPVRIASAPQMVTLASLCKNVAATIGKFQKADGSAFIEND